MMLRTILHNHRISSVVLLVLCVGIAELLLIEIKYDLFSGGFLQSHQLARFGERLYFLIIAVWMDLFFFGIIALVWYWFWAILKCGSVVVSYHYFFLAGVASLSVVGIKYKLLSYFSDTINFHIVKNLAGGSIGDALLYVQDESVILVVFFVLLAVLFYAGHVFAKRFSRRPETLSVVANQRFSSRGVLYTAVFIVSAITVAVMLFVNGNDILRYGLQKKISYSLVSKAFSALTDFDRDGYGYFSFPHDPAPFDASIYPGALDIPNNGIDEDGLAGDFVYVPGAENNIAKLHLPDKPRHLVLVMLESARADLIGKKIGEKYVAPNLMRLVQNGSYFKYAYSHTGYTTSSLKTVFTGRLLGIPGGPSLFDLLKDSGYQISVFSGQDESFGGIAATTGMMKHSDLFFDARAGQEDRVFAFTAAGSLRLDERRLLKEIKARLKTTDRGIPQFMYINFQAAHFPYHHPGMPQIFEGSPIPRSEINAEHREWVASTYWNALAYADVALGEVVEMLKGAGIYDDSLIVVTGDHGESLFEDGFLGHGHALNEIQTRVPLVFSVSGVSAQEPVGQVDLLGLILQVLSGHTRTANKNVKGGSKAVFQVVGSLDRPVQIGFVEINERRTILDLRTRKVFFSEHGQWRSYEAVMKDEKFFSRVKKLVFEWERLRWEQKNRRIHVRAPKEY